MTKAIKTVAGTLLKIDPIFYEILSFWGDLSTLKLGMQEGVFLPASKWALNLHFFRWMFWVENQSFWLCGSYLTVHLCDHAFPKTLPSYLGFQTLNPREEV